MKKLNKLKKFRKNEKKITNFYNIIQAKKKHLKQLAFHECKKKNRWVFGGNRSGKTECGAVEVVYFARGNHPYRNIKGATSGWVVSLSTQVQRDVAQNKILNYINPEWIEDVVMLSGRKDNYKHGVIDYILIKNVFGSVSKIGFKSCDQGREKFQGTSLDYVYFDENLPKFWLSKQIFASFETKIFTKLVVNAEKDVKVKLIYDDKEIIFTTYQSGINEFIFKIFGKQLKLEISSSKESANVKNVYLDYYDC